MIVADEVRLSRTKYSTFKLLLRYEYREIVLFFKFLFGKVFNSNITSFFWNDYSKMFKRWCSLSQRRLQIFMFHCPTDGAPQFLQKQTLLMKSIINWREGREQAPDKFIIFGALDTLKKLITSVTLF